mmetsp:Transcript_17491/g.50052  ORF Transcript_17491/g.50052 Transcript_17491/m.50052 type:complete len:429 (+) Transcript_17491:366-1652(+)
MADLLFASASTELDHPEPAVRHPSIIQRLGSFHLLCVHSTSELCLQRAQGTDRAGEVTSYHILEWRREIPKPIAQQPAVISVTFDKCQVASFLHIRSQRLGHFPHGKRLAPKKILRANPFAFVQVLFPAQTSSLGIGIFGCIEGGIIFHCLDQILLQGIGNECRMGLELEGDRLGGFACNEMVGKGEITNELKAGIVNNYIDHAAAFGAQLLAIIGQDIDVVVQEILLGTVQDLLEDVHACILAIRRPDRQIHFVCPKGESRGDTSALFGVWQSLNLVHNIFSRRNRCIQPGLLRLGKRIPHVGGLRLIEIPQGFHETSVGVELGDQPRSSQPCISLLHVRVHDGLPFVVLSRALVRSGLLFGQVLEMAELGLGGILELGAQVVVEIFQSLRKFRRVEFFLVLFVRSLQDLSIDATAHRVVGPGPRLF